MMSDRNISRKISDITARFDRERNYWLDKLSGGPVKSMFPYDKPAIGGQPKEADSDVVEFEITGKLLTGLMELSNSSEHRLHIVLVTILVILLDKYTGNKDIIVGSPIYKQEIDAEFINTVLVLRNQIGKNNSFKELLLQVKETMVGAIENQNYPIEKLVEELNVPSTGTGFPLFDVVVLIENIHDKKYIQYIRNNITFSFFRTGDEVKGKVEYEPLRYEKETIKRIVSHFVNLLRQILHDINIKVTDIDILSREERKQLLYDYNDTETEISLGSRCSDYLKRRWKKIPGTSPSSIKTVK